MDSAAADLSRPGSPESADSRDQPGWSGHRGGPLRYSRTHETEFQFLHLCRRESDHAQIRRRDRRGADRRAGEGHSSAAFSILYLMNLHRFGRCSGRAGFARIALAVLLSPQCAWGWGYDGHRIVAIIAADNLTPA